MVLRGASSSRVLLPVVSPRKVVPQKDHRSLNPKLQVQKTLKQTERRPLRGPSTVRPLIKKSNSRSLVAETVLPTPRKKPKAKRSVQSLKLPENVGKRAQSNQMTILESKSVSTEVLWQYGGYLKKFEAFLRANDVKVPLDAAEADAVLADYILCALLAGSGHTVKITFFDREKSKSRKVEKFTFQEISARKVEKFEKFEKSKSQKKTKNSKSRKVEKFLTF